MPNASWRDMKPVLGDHKNLLIMRIENENVHNPSENRNTEGKTLYINVKISNTDPLTMQQIIQKIIEKFEPLKLLDDSELLTTAQNTGPKSNEMIQLIELWAALRYYCNYADPQECKGWQQTWKPTAMNLSFGH
jgi:hypothetical protein